MHLSRNDLAQLDETYLAGLPGGSLRTLSVKLLLDLKELFERLEQNPSNSSRPPSSRAPWEGVAAGEERQEAVGQSAEAPVAEDTQETAPPAAVSGFQEARKSGEGTRYTSRDTGVGRSVRSARHWWIRMGTGRGRTSRVGSYPPR
jgi:transposase